MWASLVARRDAEMEDLKARLERLEKVILAKEARAQK